MKPTLRAATAALVLLSCAVAASAEDKPEPPHVAVAGEAEINIAPDEVRFDVTLQSFGKELNSPPNLSSNAVSFDRGDSTDSEGTRALGLIKVSARVTVKFELQ
jgi:uncharacterized protein YggE